MRDVDFVIFVIVVCVYLVDLCLVKKVLRIMNFNFSYLAYIARMIYKPVQLTEVKISLLTLYQ